MMFFSIRRCVVSALAIMMIATMLVCGSQINKVCAQTGTGAGIQSMPSSAPAPQAPPILGVNDPNNPYHLTAEQQQKYDAIKIKFQQDATAIMQNTAIPGAQKQGKIEQLQIASSKKLRALLTPAQLSLLNQSLALQRKVVALQQKGQTLLLALNKTVTAEQKKKIKELRTNAQAQQTQIQSSTASDEVKSDQLNDLREKYVGQVTTIFNQPQQIQILKELKILQVQIQVAEEQAQSGPH